jgi:Raf kinase inhibitor-like YbhB/YbcL family protein
LTLGNAETVMPLLLASPAIPPGNEIPLQYTCDGANTSPPLSWSDVPEGTGSFVLILEDPDAPSGLFRHWVVFDIARTARTLDAGYSAGRPAAALHEARNDFGKVGYGGPCPPKGHGTHHYHFRLFAISRPSLDLRGPPAPLEVLRAAQPYVLQQAEFVGTYRR